MNIKHSTQAKQKKKIENLIQQQQQHRRSSAALTTTTTNELKKIKTYCAQTMNCSRFSSSSSYFSFSFASFLLCPNQVRHRERVATKNINRSAEMVGITSRAIQKRTGV